MSQPDFKAPNQKNAVSAKQLHRDTRTTLDQIVATCGEPMNLAIIIISFAFISFIYPAYSFVLITISAIFYWLRTESSKKDKLPFRMPMTSFLIDYGQPKPGRQGFSKASGLFYVGNIFGEYSSELWLGLSDMLTHMLIFGTTGSGKTETLVSLSFNAIAMGSGLFYVDPKGSPKLLAQMYVMARFCGRDDDYRTINYLVAEKGSVNAKMPLRTTNTTNPFSYGNAESLSNMLNSLIPKAEGSNAIFSSNARNLMKSIMYALVEMRNRGEINLSARTIRDYLTLSKVMAIAERSDFSKNTTDAVRAFLTSVGWQEGKDEKSQPKSLAEQFGYARSYFGDPLNNLTDTYGHIYGSSFGEVDMRDVVMNRRILVIIIPSLAMAQDEVKSLGVMSLSAIRIAISVGLGTGKEGSFSDILYALPTESRSPFLSITDEYAAIPTPGYVEVLTQGRGLGIAAIIASQDFAGISKADKEGAQQILENTRTKFFMKSTAAGETFDVAKGLAGEITVMETGGHAIKTDSQAMIPDYRDTLNASPKDRSKIKLEDLQNQIEGEFHGFFGSTMVRGRTFYAAPPLPANAQMQYNHLVAIYPVEQEVLDDFFGDLERLLAFFKKRYASLPPLSASPSEKEKQMAIDASEFSAKEWLDNLKSKANSDEIDEDDESDSDTEESDTESEKKDTKDNDDINNIHALFKGFILKNKSDPMRGVANAFIAFHNAKIERIKKNQLFLEEQEQKKQAAQKAQEEIEALETPTVGESETDETAYKGFVFEDDSLFQPGEEDDDDFYSKKADQLIAEIEDANEKINKDDDSFASDILKIEKLVTPDDEKAKIRAEALISSIDSAKSDIVSSLPSTPTPENDSNKKKLLSARVNEIIKKAEMKKNQEKDKK